MYQDCDAFLTGTGTGTGFLPPTKIAKISLQLMLLFVFRFK
jgi:hypothetical protein